jgi:hypothetical protein
MIEMGVSTAVVAQMDDEPSWIVWRECRNMATLRTAGGHLMIRFSVFASMFAAGIASLGSQAMAQSPNPALLAPSGGRAGLAPSHTVARPPHTSPRPGGTPANMKSQRGHHLSHPRAHGL